MNPTPEEKAAIRPIGPIGRGALVVTWMLSFAAAVTLALVIDHAVHDHTPAPAEPDEPDEHGHGAAAQKQPSKKSGDELAAPASPTVAERDEDHSGHAHGEAHDHDHAEEGGDHGAEEPHEHDHEAGADHDHAHEGHGHDGGGEDGGEGVVLQEGQIHAAGLETAVAGPAKVADLLTVSGEVTLNPDATAHVAPTVPGAVRAVLRQVGDVVKRGDVLAVLDSRELAELRRQVETARARVQLAERTYGREAGLWKKGLNAERDYLAARQALDEARIDLRSAESKRRAAASRDGGEQAGYELVSPIDGIVLERHAERGETLSESDTAFVVADLTTVWVSLIVPAPSLARIRVGQRVLLEAEGVDMPLEGTLSYVSPVVAEGRRGAEARVVIDNRARTWRPGLFVTGRIAAAEGTAGVAVEVQALQKVEQRDVVFVVGQAGRYEARPVVLGQRRSVDLPVRVEVLAGLRPGERYVTKGSFSLKAEQGKGEAHHEH